MLPGASIHNLLFHPELRSTDSPVEFVDFFAEKGCTTDDLNEQDYSPCGLIFITVVKETGLRNNIVSNLTLQSAFSCGQPCRLFDIVLESGAYLQHSPELLHPLPVILNDNLVDAVLLL